VAPPNLILLITDQQRTPRHWPQDPAWLDALMPAEAELRRTALTFDRAYCATAMCSPSRASLLTGRWPSEHGVELTLTSGGAEPESRHAPHAIRQLLRDAVRGSVPRAKLARTFVDSVTRTPDDPSEERELDPATPNLARILARAGYTTVLKGKWHLTKPVDGNDWGDGDPERLARDYGIQGWEPPDAGDDLNPEHFGGGNAGPTHEGWDESYIRQAEAFLADPPPEPWALIVSLVNPHDVLGYPDSFAEGGFRREDWADLGAVGLPPTLDESLADKPTVHTLMRIGQASFLGPLSTREQQLDYVRFYAHLHRVVDEKVGRLLDALGDPADPGSLRSQTVIVRTSDHGEMGLSHGGLRQKMFNAYEETINVPLVVSCPTLFPEAVTTDALASLCDVLPTFAGLAGVDVSGDGVRGRDLAPILAHHSTPDAERLAVTPVDFRSVCAHAAPAPSVQDAVHFAFDDDKSGTAYRDSAPPPNRVRAVRTADAMYALYVDPQGRAAPEFELYDTELDPDQADNLVDRATGRVRHGADEPLRAAAHARLLQAMDESGTTPPPAAGVPRG
jgi:choline-sulfatase